MAGNLHDRLKRIQQGKRTETVAQTAGLSPRQFCRFTDQGWIPAGHLTLRREVTGCEGFELPETVPDAASIVAPGMRGGTAYEDLLFFDLETTGLSGGAGTIAFLAAFGRLDRTGRAGQGTAVYTLRITQYLLLDYPGESDFIESLLGEFSGGADGGVTMVSYNGRCFDSQILATRCLMNRTAPPEYRHADLLYPARRLWKTLLPDCSQAAIETGIFGIDRTGDIPGAMAPEIWFSFLKRGEAGPLLGICEHNRRDIAGLAVIFSAMMRIARDPFSAMQKITFDIETFSLRWHEQCRYEAGTPLRETGEKLLRYAAETACPRAELRYGLILLRAKNYDEGRKWLHRAADKSRPSPLRIAALRALAIDSEHRMKNTAEALSLTEQALELLPPESSQQEEFERRIGRLRGYAASLTN